MAYFSGGICHMYYYFNGRMAGDMSVRVQLSVVSERDLSNESTSDVKDLITQGCRGTTHGMLTRPLIDREPWRSL